MDVNFFDARLIMWDDANDNFNYKPSLAHVHRLTWSSYYGGNCTKYGVNLQCCGWIGVWDSWTGGVSDSECLISFNNEKGMSIIEKEQLFQKDLANGKN